jgi:hypothetical protein
VDRSLSQHFQSSDALVSRGPERLFEDVRRKDSREGHELTGGWVPSPLKQLDLGRMIIIFWIRSSAEQLLNGLFRGYILPFSAISWPQTFSNCSKRMTEGRIIRCLWHPTWGKTVTSPAFITLRWRGKLAATRGTRKSVNPYTSRGSHFC